MNGKGDVSSWDLVGFAMKISGTLPMTPSETSELLSCKKAVRILHVIQLQPLSRGISGGKEESLLLLASRVEL